MICVILPEMIKKSHLALTIVSLVKSSVASILP